MSSFLSKTLLAITFMVCCNFVLAQDSSNNFTDIKLRLAVRENKDLTSLLKNKKIEELSKVTLLMIAAAAGDYDAVKFLVDNSIQDNSVYLGQDDIKYTIPKENSVELDGLRKILGDTFEPLLSNYLDIRLQLGRYIRAETTCGYTALIYAVVGGWDNIVDYLITEIKKRAGVEKADEHINKTDCRGWNAILYAVSYKEEETNDKKAARVNILSTLIKNGANTKVTGVFKEGELNLVNIATKYNHLELIKYLRSIHEQNIYSGIKGLLLFNFGDALEITKSLNDAIKLANDKETKEELINWKKELWTEKVTVNSGQVLIYYDLKENGDVENISFYTPLENIKTSAKYYQGNAYVEIKGTNESTSLIINGAKSWNGNFPYVQKKD